MIRLQSVSKRYGARLVLNSLSLEMESGKTHVLIGPSGCGKSTLLRLIAGLLEPDTGTLQVGDIHVSAATQRLLARRLGYVIQEGGLFPHLTARDNVALRAKLLGTSEGWPAERIQARVQELAQLAELDSSVLNRFPRELSGGQRQRVSLMRALMMDPPTLLLDEPLGSLDPLVRAGLRRELKNIFNRLGKTVVLVTHDLDEAAFFGHSIALMHDGKVEQRGTFIELAKRPASAFVSEFINAQKPSEFFREIL